jgi:molecular chaperone GrpE (heat shock protein)
MYLFVTVHEWLSKHFMEIAMAFMYWNVRFFSKRIRDRIETYQELPEWKQTAIRDFKFWLEDLPDTIPGDKGGITESCDLYTLLSEFSALRQEIKIQNREQSRTLETLGSFIGAYQETFDIFKEKTGQLAELEERIRYAGERKAVLPFLDVRDALIRGQKASLELSEAFQDLALKSKGFFRSLPKGTDEIIEGMKGIAEGYEMAVRRFDRALELVEIYPTDTVGQPFDPKTMKAVGKRSEPEKDPGTVLEEYLSGFIRRGEMVRIAQVIVNAKT